MEERFTIKYRWAITISLLLASIVLLYFTFIYKLPNSKANVKSSSPKVVATSSMNHDIYSKISLYHKDCDYPFVQTDSQNVFYSVKPYEDLTLFEFTNGNFNKLSNVNDIKLSLTINGEKVPIKVHYTVRNDKTVGYGIYQTKDKNKINKYAFIKLCDMPEEMKSDYDLLLIIDLDYNDIFKSNKTYSEIFQLSSKTKQATRLVSESSREISVNSGKLRNDYSIVTDYTISQCRDRLLFLSSRNYKLDKGKYAKDVYSQYEYTKNPKLVAQDVLGDFVSQDSSGVLYLKNLDGNSFSLVKNIDGEKQKTIKTFDGQIDNGYKLCGNYLFDENSMTIYNLKNNNEYTIFNISLDSIKSFDLSQDEQKLVAYGTLSNGQERLVFYDLSRKRGKHIDGEKLVHSEYPNLKFIDNNRISYIKQSGNDKQSLENVVVSWDEIFSKVPDK